MTTHLSTTTDAFQTTTSVEHNIDISSPQIFNLISSSPIPSAESIDNERSFVNVIEPNDISLPSTSAIIQENEATTPRKLAYDQFEFSPFKHYLKISDSTIISRKKKNKTKTPPAISGTDYHKNLIRVQREKAALEKEKEKRKLERESKKLNKTKAHLNKDKGKVSKKRHHSDTDEEEESDTRMALVDDSDSDVEEGLENICSGCLGDDGVEDHFKWIGCNKCPRWYHKSCLAEELEQMSQEEIEAYNFICNICTKLLNKNKTKTNSSGQSSKKRLF